MAGGSLHVVGVSQERAGRYQGRATIYVVVASIIAAVGGSIFGYDIGISGGVTSMDPFLKKFFPTVYHRKHSEAKDSDYCKYNNQAVAMFTSSLYIAGLFASLAASYVTRLHGRKISIICGGISFMSGAVLNASAVNLVMLFIGRILLGVGIGFGNQAVPLYLSELAPAKLRGGLNMLFQLATTSGIFTANMVNYGTQKIEPWGWRLSLGIAAAPAFLMTVGGLYIPETPNSLIEQGRLDKGRAVLERIRGTKDVDAEFDDMMEASELAKSIKHPFRNILIRRNRPQLVMAICMPTFQIMTGINSILFYAPVLFQSLGFGANASLYSSVMTGAVLVGSTIVSIVLVDRLGRRVLLISGGIQMVICQVTVSIILGLKFGGDKELSKGFSVFLVIMICLFVAAFGWSWGPLGWTVPSEIFPLETRSAGQAITVTVNLFFTFVIAQSFLSLLCTFKFGIFLFFAGWIFIMTVFVYFLLPETKGVPIEEMILLWRKHWFWKKIVPPLNSVEGNGKLQDTESAFAEATKNGLQH
ncbi:sugar transport protein 7 [Cryptomeria japonica]|uniref:sugar transport protein 7 n=1 Tax=Cryptomeria japonica TaxID=3369 RepID=UPI0027DA5A3F|nr:sugar transport protein 7 [Cryptomeria japonica]